MCGIVGMAFANSQALSVIEQMTDALYTRGPDGRGIWQDPAAGISFGHRRLAIVDLSAEGHQPMTSNSGRYVITFNGEIYNFAAIRQALLKQANLTFRGHSDTEVLLAAIEQWGIEKTLKNCVGMFAFALWDKQSRTLTLARDRLGEKPLYYGFIGQTFVFTSELKALKPLPNWNRAIDQTALQSYLRYGYVPAPLCIYQGLAKLPQGSYLTLNTHRQTNITSYWSAYETALSAAKNPVKISFKQAVDELDKRLRDAIKLQSFADVPVGAFLSGGVDSSTLVALMQAESKQPVHTFSIGFSEKNVKHFNEAEFAKAIAKHLNTDHQELYVSAAECQSVVMKLPEIYDEPLADASQVPTYLVSKLARGKVTVALSGDGGDELFAGYKRYRLIARQWNSFSKTPYGLRRFAGRLLTHLREQDLSKPNKHAKLGFKLRHKYADLWQSVQSFEDYYQAQLSATLHPERWLKAPINTHLSRWQETIPKAGLNELNWMMACDALTYLPDQILAKVDRAAMAVSLETRIPLLDHRICEFAWQLPLSYKFQGQQDKRVLREVLYRYVPKNLVDRPKMGFNIPLSRWLRGGLKPWAESVLDPQKLAQQGLWNVDMIQHFWRVHQAEIHNTSPILWNILMFQAWLDQQ